MAPVPNRILSISVGYLKKKDYHGSNDEDFVDSNHLRAQFDKIRHLRFLFWAITHISTNVKIEKK